MSGQQGPPHFFKERPQRRFIFVLKSQCVATNWSDRFAEPTAGLLASRDQSRSG
jgi:hypothetical protein